MFYNNRHIHNKHAWMHAYIRREGEREREREREREKKKTRRELMDFYALCLPAAGYFASSVVATSRSADLVSRSCSSRLIDLLHIRLEKKSSNITNANSEPMQCGLKFGYADDGRVGVRVRFSKTRVRRSVQYGLAPQTAIKVLWL